MLISALSFHRIGTQVTHDVWIQLPQNAKAPKFESPPIRLARTRLHALSTKGVHNHHLGDIDMPITSPARTVADCFKHRNKLGIDVCVEALRETLKARKATIGKIHPIRSPTTRRIRNETLLGGNDMKNGPASIRAKLLNLSRQNGESLNALLEQYAMSKFLCRLAQSPHRTQFVLKGAQLFRVWQAESRRPTCDLDLLGFGDPSETALQTLFEQILTTPQEFDDGLTRRTVSTSSIRDEVEYGGVRLIILAMLDKARITLQVDIGFGDAITPKAREQEWRSILDFPSAQLLTYPPETAIAEKLHAAVVLEATNSRMKDFFDLHWLSTNKSFSGKELQKAIQTTFERRNTKLPTTPPLAQTNAFASRPEKPTPSTRIQRDNLTNSHIPHPCPRKQSNQTNLTSKNRLDTSKNTLAQKQKNTRAHQTSADHGHIFTRPCGRGNFRRKLAVLSLHLRRILQLFTNLARVHLIDSCFVHTQGDKPATLDLEALRFRAS